MASRRIVEERISQITRSLACLALLAAVVLGACNDSAKKAAALTGGDPTRGPLVMGKYGCQSCHTIPGVRGADGRVGPALTDLAGRVYIAGRIPNTPENLMAWIQHPQRLSPGVAMPDMNVSERDARDIAAYLYSVR